MDSENLDFAYNRYFVFLSSIRTPKYLEIIVSSSLSFKIKLTFVVI